ncbi:MAG TPA: hypothetical protein VIG99_07865 [Myxococcaceae bacterium]|jgi:hypothetical protein
MTSKRISSALTVAVGLASLAPATAVADSQVRYSNRSGQVLHLYYAVTPHGGDIDCRNLVYGGTVEPGSSWQHFVPSNHWTWVRFLEDPRDGGCTPSGRDEWRYSGTAYGYQAHNVW